jgi:hypothetical protein
MRAWFMTRSLGESRDEVERFRDIPLRLAVNDRRGHFHS